MTGRRVRGADLRWVAGGAGLAVLVMLALRVTGLPPTGGWGLAVTMAALAAVFLLAFPLLERVGVRGPGMLRAVVLMLAGATLWDGMAIASAPAWYGGEGTVVSAAAATILFGVGVLLLVAVPLADRGAAATDDEHDRRLATRG